MVWCVWINWDPGLRQYRARARIEDTISWQSDGYDVAVRSLTPCSFRGCSTYQYTDGWHPVRDSVHSNLDRCGSATNYNVNAIANFAWLPGDSGHSLDVTARPAVLGPTHQPHRPTPASHPPRDHPPPASTYRRRCGPPQAPPGGCLALDRPPRRHRPPQTASTFRAYPASHPPRTLIPLRQSWLDRGVDATRLRTADTQAAQGLKRRTWADRLMPSDHGRRLAALLPHATLVEVDDSYTLIPLDQPTCLAGPNPRLHPDVAIGPLAVRLG